MRNWALGGPAWVWPDDVDRTGTDSVGASRYLPVMQRRSNGDAWQVAKVLVDEDDAEMLDDARLIAAAPALLAALKAHIPWRDAPVQGWGAWGDAIAAIAQAEGWGE